MTSTLTMLLISPFCFSLSYENWVFSHCVGLKVSMQLFRRKFFCSYLFASLLVFLKKLREIVYFLLNI